MPRRYRIDSGADDDVSREDTPASTAPNDSKRARQSVTVENTPLPSRILNGVSSISKRRAEPDRSGVDGRAQTRAHFQPGAIVRVKLDNFVTYTSAEFFPGPNLNMVIGPNGTGKSTLVCAICLGLGWGPSQLGRAKEVAEFVKYGCKEATVEIELQRKTEGKFNMEANPVIRRLIKREGNKSSYTLNGQPISGKNLLEFAKSFNIQIDNLCQFLPQDRVVEFAQMNPVELLHSTQQAAAEPEMFGLHEDLKSLRKRQRELLRDHRGDREELANRVNRQEMQRVEVEQTRERVKTKRRLDWLERCRPIPLYGEAKKRAKDAKDQQKQLSRELHQLESEVGPTLKQVNAKQKYEQQVRALKRQREQDAAEGATTCEKTEKKISKLDDTMRECEDMEAAERRGVAKKKQDRQTFQQQITRLQRQIEAEPEPFDARSMNEQIHQLTAQKRELEATANAKRAQSDDAKRQGTERKEAIERLKKRSENLETLSGQQASKLEGRSRDSYRAWQWIQEHRNAFQKEVFGPPMVECSLTDARMANAVEALFQENEFKIITVQCLEDFHMLQHQLNREMKLHDVSLRVCSESLDQFRPPMAQEELRRLGLDSWALDNIRGPDTVLAMLCSEKRLHQSALGLKEIPDAQYNAIVAAGIQTFVAGNTSYRAIKRAEYDDTFVNTRDVRPARIWTSQPVDHALKARIAREISEKKDEGKHFTDLYNAVKAELSEMANQYHDLEKEISAIKDDKDQKQHALSVWKALPAQVAQRQEKLAAIDQNLDGVRERITGIRKDKDRYMLERADLTLRFAAEVSRLRELQASLLQVELLHIEALSDRETLEARNEHIRDLVTAKQKARKDAEAAAKKALDQAKKLVEGVRQLQVDGQEMDEQGDPDLTNLLQEVSNKGMTTDELEAEIDSLKASLELTHGVSSHIIQEYEERAQTIEKLRDRMGNFREALTTVNDSIAEVRGLWEPQLLEVVEKISDAFSASFARIGCAGSVTVFKASVPNDELDAELSPPAAAGEEGNGLDFANWAIHVSVKFRESEPLSLLDSHRQSGGERAVSTIFYLMALQSLSRAPFRVVDEINQGMDPRNERMVHGRMVEIAANGHHPNDEQSSGSQYFLITPKLLPGLEYRRGMCVHCIVSGENMPAVVKTEFGGQQHVVERGGKMDFRALARKARALGLATVGRRTDSGVSLERSFGSSGDSRASGMDGERSSSQMTEVVG